MQRRQVLAGTALLAMSGIGKTWAQAQAGSANYPNQVIKFVAPFPPGGTVDILTRAVSSQLAREVGQQVIVDNRGGAGGTIGADAVARSSPDGYTILFGATHHAIAQSVYPKLGYDIRSMTPLAFLGRVDHVLLVTNKLPVKDVSELIAYAKANPDKLNYGTPGSGTLHHLMAEQFKSTTGSRMVHVAYKGSGAAMIDLISGSIHVYFETMPSALQHVRSGAVRAIAVTSKQRSEHLPSIPTIADSGVPSYDASSWYGAFGPPNTPQSIVDRLNKAFDAAFRNREFAAQWKSLGAETGGGSPDVLRSLVTKEVDRWGAVAKAANIRIE
jgi:tripartite-type tricarboxylate transporter receptor subunit TctC